MAFSPRKLTARQTAKIPLGVMFSVLAQGTRLQETQPRESPDISRSLSGVKAAMRIIKAYRFKYLKYLMSIQRHVLKNSIFTEGHHKWVNCDIIRCGGGLPS